MDRTTLQHAFGRFRHRCRVGLFALGWAIRWYQAATLSEGTVLLLVVWVGAWGLGYVRRMKEVRCQQERVIG